MHKYEVITYWSNGTRPSSRRFPDLPGCSSHGDTRAGALQSVEHAIDLWIETAREFGDPVPERRGERLMLA